LLVTLISLGQAARKEKVKGPRATGLIELAGNGKAHLIPITIMVDGKFYDASAYKADPVPYALGSEVVYEAMRTGVPQGEFTVTGALQAQDTWFGEGKWVPEGSKPKKKKVADSKPNFDDDSGPPTLHKAGGAKSTSAPASTPPSSGPPAPSTPAPSSTPPTSAPSASAPPPGSSDKSHDGDDHASAASDQSSTTDSSETANDEDPNRPSLRRGKHASSSTAPSTASSTAAPSASRSSTPSLATSGSSVIAKPKDAPKVAAALQLLPAVSDAGGPEPRPYAFDMKPEEEQNYRKKLLAIASAAVVAKAKEMTPVMPSAEPAKRTPAKPGAKAGAKPAQPQFENVQFRAFDLWNTNEPVFVMTAQARLASGSATKTAGSDSPYFITLVAKADIYLDLHKLLAQVTDDHHLDEFPRFELIDAVDADGDGRGELLFREVSDAGSAYAIYRAAADQLYLLFEGKPQSAHPMPTSVQ
jgi:hypothetical protein